MAKIAVDIDSTLYDFETPSREACLQLWQETGDARYKEAAYHPWTEWRSPADVLADPDGGVQRWLDAIALVHDDEKILAMEPFKGAVETCNALMDEGHQLIYISNRATETVHATQRWLLKHGFLPNEYFVDDTHNRFERGERPQSGLVVTTGDKRPFIRECQYLIDDRLKTCVEFVYDYAWEERIRDVALGYSDPQEAYVGLQRRAFVPAYPYNQAATDIPRLYLAPTWAGLNIYMQRKGLLPEVAYTAKEAV